LLPPATGVCAMGHHHRVASITESEQSLPDGQPPGRFVWQC
jgi:hypothetical protein